MNRLLPFFRAIKVVVGCIFLLTACKPPLPNGVLSEGKMEDVLYDFHLAQGMAETVPFDEGHTLEQVRYEYLQAVLKKHDITEAEFDSSLVFYCSDLTRMNRIYSHLTARLQREADALGVATGPRDVFEGLTAEGDTANVWRDRPLFVVKSQVMDNLQAWEQECDSTWEPGDDVLWRFSVQMLAKNFRTGDSYADLVIHYTNDSIRSHLAMVGIHKDFELKVDNPRDWTPKKVIGHIYTAVEAKAEDMHYIFVIHPSLIRFHQPASVREQWARDTLQTDSLALDTLTSDTPLVADSVVHRRTPEEFREEQVVTPSINVVKEKPYQPGKARNRRRRQMPS